MKYENCIICKRKLPKNRHPNRKYCAEDKRDCAEIAKQRDNKRRYEAQPKECQSCHNIVTELGMRKRCRECIMADKTSKVKEHECASENCTRMVRTESPFCRICRVDQARKKRYCANEDCGKDITKGTYSQAKYCSKECSGDATAKKYKVKQEKAVENEPPVNPIWTQPLGSKRRK